MVVTNLHQLWLCRNHAAVSALLHTGTELISYNIIPAGRSLHNTMKLALHTHTAMVWGGDSVVLRNDDARFIDAFP